MKKMLFPVSAIALAVLAGCGGDGSETPQAVKSIRVLSSPAEMISAGDAVIEIRTEGSPLQHVEVAGRDVTSAFVMVADSRYVGLVNDLPQGASTVSAHTAASNVKTLAIQNFPAYGPVFSGTRERPWVCETETSGLGAAPATGPCVAPTQYDWFYRTTANTFKPLASTAKPYPADLATTTTIDGHVVNYIVRVESGVINESIYRIAVIEDPAAPTDNPWATNGTKPGIGWNGKLTWPFGGGCNAGYRSGSNAVTSALDDTALSLGFAVAFGTRNTMGTGCNDVISAETVMMVKERFIEQYGLPKFTISNGSSGGAMQQHLITQNYPGLFDAITPGRAYPDLASIAPDVMDCKLLNSYFDKNAVAWTADNRAAIEGYAIASTGASVGKTTCQVGWPTYAGRWSTPADGGFSDVIAPTLRYNAITNPMGARGSYWDANVNSFGRDPVNGFARSAYSNRGIQYGLEAVNAGTLAPEEFVLLNENIGGLDIDGSITAARSEGDDIAIRRAYASGRVFAAANNLTLPIINTRNYLDTSADIHSKERTLMILERIRTATGTTENVVAWVTSGANAPDLAAMALKSHNQWLEAIAADAAAGSYAEKVIRNRPANLKDACWADGIKIEEKPTWDMNSACNQAQPLHKNVRLSAGGSLAGDVMKCQLKPLNFREYQVTFSSEQQTRLQRVFPMGVCDWSQPDAQQTAPQPWIDFSVGQWGPASIHN